MKHTIIALFALIGAAACSNTPTPEEPWLEGEVIRTTIDENSWSGDKWIAVVRTDGVSVTITSSEGRDDEKLDLLVRPGDHIEYQPGDDWMVSYDQVRVVEPR